MSKRVPDDMKKGCVYFSNNDGLVVVKDYKNSLNVEIEFVNTGHKTVVQAGHLRKGLVKDRSVERIPEDMQVGKVHKTNNYGELEIVEYRNTFDVVVRFLDTGFTTSDQAGHIREGFVKDLYAPTVFGVGYLGVGPYEVSVASKTTPLYNKWVNMIQRCYDPKTQERQPAYKGVTVHPLFHNFQYFADWSYHHAQENNLGPRYALDLELDKDKLQPDVPQHEKVYSPETCVYITKEENLSLSNKQREAA